MSISNPTDNQNAGGQGRLPQQQTRPSVATISPSMMVPNVTTPPTRPGLPQIEIPPEAAETADELFQRLRRLCAEGRVEIDLDNKRLMHIDSPVSFEAWGNQWVYALLLLTGAIWYFFGYKIGIGAAVVSVALYLTVAKAFLRRRIERRVREQVLEDVVRWRKLWNFGGVALHVAGGTGGSERCESPRDNWMDLVRRLSKT